MKNVTVGHEASGFSGSLGYVPKICSWEAESTEGKASRLLLKILKKAIPCTLRNILRPAVFPQSPLLPSGDWALCTFLSLHFAASFPYVACSPTSFTEAPCIYLLMPTGSNICLHASKKNQNLLSLNPFPSTLILFVLRFLTIVEPPWRIPYNPPCLLSFYIAFYTSGALGICVHVSLLTQ